MKKQKLYNDIIQECYEFFERMSSKYIDIIEKDSQCIDISIPTFNDVNYNISPIREVSIKFNVYGHGANSKSNNTLGKIHKFY